MKKLISSFVVVLLVCCVSTPQSTQATSTTDSVEISYYVRADGDDSNAGISENTPFATLSKAIQVAMTTPVKKVTLIGTITDSITISDSGAEEIFITGKPDASEHEKAVLVVLNQTALEISGDSNIRLEHIVLQGKSEANNAISRGITINGAVVTLGNNVLITQFATNNGAGVFLQAGNLYMTGNATIAGNIARRSGGGIYMNGGTLVMDGNSAIRNNEARSPNSIDAGGGGIFMWGGTAELKENSLITGNTAKVSGGGVYAAGRDLIIGGISIWEIGEDWGAHTFDSGNIHGNSAVNGPDVYEMYA